MGVCQCMLPIEVAGEIITHRDQKDQQRDTCVGHEGRRGRGRCGMRAGGGYVVSYVIHVRACAPMPCNSCIHGKCQLQPTTRPTKTPASWSALREARSAPASCTMPMVGGVE